MTNIDDITQAISDWIEDGSTAEGWDSVDELVSDYRHEIEEDATRMADRIQAVRDLHRRTPIYDTLIEDCDEHDSEVHGIELDDGEVYCDQHVSDYVCEHCADLDENCNTETSYPCPTIRALDGEQ